MKMLHTMIRVLNLEKSLDFYTNKLGLVEKKRKEVEAGRFTLVFLQAPDGGSELELTYNWDQTEPYSHGRNFGHICLEVENIYKTCQHLQDQGITINRPPRDGYMAFINDPDGISIELLQKGEPLPMQTPWKDMGNTGSW